ncbi:MAG: 3-oxoacyl-[acyl-carrier-protein] reductase [Pseudomonadota bacterium]
MFNLEGKTALITGATGGIGSAIAQSFYQAGASVILSGTRQQKLDELKQHFDNQRALCIQCNLSEPDAPKQLIEKSLKTHDNIDILVNNAAITRDQLLLRMSDENWQNVLKLNLEIPSQLARYALKPMMKNRWGRIINIASIVAITGNAGQTNYAAAKAGLIAFSKSLASEVATRSITVNSIAPGFIETEMTADLNDKQRQSILDNIAMKRMGTPVEIAAGALYLASDEAAYITGTTLHINGGLAMI